MASDDEGGLDLFQEPDGYFEPEKEATFATHKLLSGKEFNVRLVGHNPLWVRQHLSSGYVHQQGSSQCHLSSPRLCSRRLPCPVSIMALRRRPNDDDPL